MKSKVPNRSIKQKTLKALLARSGNQCAFEGCNHPLFNEENIFVAQICHIEAVSPNGPRFNPVLSSAKINSYENLIFLCYRHHKEIDSIEAFTIEKLKEIKRRHENKFMEPQFSVDDKILEKLLEEVNNYWKRVEHLNTILHVTQDFRLPIDVTKDEIKLIEDIRGQLKTLLNILNTLTVNLQHEYFEITCLAIPNVSTKLSVLLDQLEIKLFENKLNQNPSSKMIKRKLNALRMKFEQIANSVGLAD